MWNACVYTFGKCKRYAACRFNELYDVPRSKFVIWKPFVILATWLMGKLQICMRVCRHPRTLCTQHNNSRTLFAHSPLHEHCWTEFVLSPKMVIMHISSRLITISTFFSLSSLSFEQSSEPSNGLCIVINSPDERKGEIVWKSGCHLYQLLELDF